MATVVHNFEQLNRTFKNASKDINREYRKELRTVAEPVQRSAEALAVSEIPRIGARWSRMRVGITTRLVYVAPRQRGVKGRGLRRRPNLGTLLMDRAMQPALERNEHRVADSLDDMFGRLVHKWDTDGP